MIADIIVLVFSILRKYKLLSELVHAWKNFGLQILGKFKWRSVDNVRLVKPI